MKGDFVIIRAFGNEPLIRRVWSYTKDAVYVCTEDNYNALERGEKGMNPVGFSREDVFKYDGSKLDDLVRNYKTDQTIWCQLSVWA